MMCGGTGDVKDADADIQELCNMVRPQVEEKINSSCSEYVAKQYKSQVVAGMNYFVKIHVGGDVHTHVRIYKPLPGQGDPSVHSVQHNKSAADAIEYF